ncbi:MAG: CpaF family protein [Acidimicrobiales bacterium]
MSGPLPEEHGPGPESDWVEAIAGVLNHDDDPFAAGPNATLGAPQAPKRAAPAPPAPPPPPQPGGGPVQSLVASDLARAVAEGRIELPSLRRYLPEPGPTPDAPVAALPEEQFSEPPSAGVEEIKRHAQEALFGELGSRLYDRAMTDDELNEMVVSFLVDWFQTQDVDLTPDERRKLTKEMTDDILRHGPIEPFLQDASISEVMVNGPNRIYIERAGRLLLTNAHFVDEGQLRRVIERIVARVGRRIDESSPMVDARLPDGSRVNAIIPPLAVDGPALTIRKFTADGFTAADLVRLGSMTGETAALLEACVKGRLNILVSGGTGSGKTTLLNVLSSFIPDTERIVTIEDSVELKLRQRHVVRLESRPPNVEGRGAVAIRDLVRNSLRMRPDRIVVGECRSGETLDMLQAMNTGHDGSLSTLHANSPRDALARCETMVLMAGMDLPLRAIREQIASAVDLIVHIDRMRDGTRRLTSLSEVVGMEGDVITLNDLFRFDYSAGQDAQGNFVGKLLPTGLRPTFVDRLADVGITLPPSLFGGDWGKPRKLTGGLR